jgi:hypothetical protein
MVHTTSTKVLLTTTLRPVVAQLSGALAQGVRLLDQCLHDELTPQKMATFEGELMWFVLYGPPAANTGNFTVGGATEIITFFPGVRLVRNARKINARIQANVRGFLATL